MTLRCREVRHWLTEGELSTSERLRLEEHLQSCSRCAREAETLDGIATLLRDDMHDPGAARLDRIWHRIEGEASGEASPLQAVGPLRRHRLAVALAAAAVALLALGAGAIWLHESAPAPDETLAVERPAPKTAPTSKHAHRARPARSKATPRTKPFGWQLVSSEHIRVDGRVAETVGPRQLLTTRARGRAVLASKRELLLVMASTQLRFSKDGREVELLQGTIAIQTETVATSPEVRVLARGVLIQPVGTLFTVRLLPGKAPEVSVLDGRVALRGPRAGAEHGKQLQVDLPAGQALRWGERPRRVSATLRRELSNLARLAAGAPTRARSTRRSKSKLASSLKSIKAALAAGAHGKARERARRLLLEPAAVRKAPLLLTLIAESYAAERDFNGARAAYLRAQRRFPRHALGAHGVYMAAPLALDQLHKPKLAEAELRRYLARYARGRQRQGAHLLLCKALLARGATAAAKSQAAAYHREFPRGRYTRELKQLLSSR